MATAKKRAKAPKKAAKKAASKKTASAKKAAATKKTAAAKKPAPKKKSAAAGTGPIRQPLKKNEIIERIAEVTELNKKQVTAVLDELESLIERSVRRRSVGEIQIPGLIKISRKKVKARKKRMGRDMRTGEPMPIPAKPAHTTVAVKALKKLRDMSK